MRAASRNGSRRRLVHPMSVRQPLPMVDYSQPELRSETRQPMLPAKLLME
jgi:hypothetical protein